MKKYVLKTNALTKSYKNANALQNVTLSLESGRIYGLIGQNGAGKTTLMRIIAGLSYPTTGSIELFGHTRESELKNERKRLGCMIEHPGFIPNMTAKENLRFYRIMRGIPNSEIEDDLLKLVSLSDTNKKKAKDFSLGMKQRLGIATALISNPEFLILDEPVNGLDPMGVVDIRKLLKKLCDERQMTILISSHNLPELYQTATDYIIIHKGEIKKALTLTELEGCCSRYIQIVCEHPERLASVLEMKLNIANYKVMPDKTVRLYDYLNEPERVSKTLHENDIFITSFSNEGDTLEDYFISVIGGGKNV